MNFKSRTALVLFASMVLGVAAVGIAAEQTKNPVVVMETSEGNITIELFQDKAPKTVENFLAYAKSNFFRGTIFHRVIRSFMIQGGGFTRELGRKKTLPAIPNEANNGIRNKRGTIAMARTGDPNSATSQFFINVADNRSLDYQGPDNFGYCVFGEVKSGMGIVNKIEEVETSAKGQFKNLPVSPVVIRNVRIKE